MKEAIKTPDAAGSHLSAYERALGKYLIGLVHAPVTSLEDLAKVDVTHEAYHMSDAGTGWPAETSIVYWGFNHQVRKDGTRSVSSRASSVATVDILELMKELLEAAGN